jgi:lipoprotein-anchoring transpeptidase ErfK/SrfK
MGVAVGTGPVHADTVWSRAVVDLSDQRVYIYDTAGTLVREWPVSTGAAATPTPTGRFRVESRSRSTFVRDNPSVTMAYMVRFNRGVGFHAIPRQNGTPLPTPLGERGVSHGCVRLADRHAAALYRNLTSDAVVVVRR